MSARGVLGLITRSVVAVMLGYIAGKTVLPRSTGYPQATDSVTLTAGLLERLTTVSDPLSADIDTVVSGTPAGARVLLAREVLRQLNAAINGSDHVQKQRIRLAILRALGKDADFTAPYVARYISNSDPLQKEAFDTLLTFGLAGWDAIASMLRRNPFTANHFSEVTGRIVRHAVNDLECADYIFKNVRYKFHNENDRVVDSAGMAVLHIIHIVDIEDATQIVHLSQCRSSVFRMLVLLAAERMPARDFASEIIYRGLSDPNDEIKIVAAYCVFYRHYSRVTGKSVPKKYIDQAVSILRLQDKDQRATSELLAELLSRVAWSPWGEKTVQYRRDLIDPKSSSLYSRTAVKHLVSEGGVLPSILKSVEIDVDYESKRCDHPRGLYLANVLSIRSAEQETGQ